MHQPFYHAADPSYWDGEKDSIFATRGGNYTTFIPNAVNQYASANLPHAGLSTSWSGSLIEQLDRCARENLCGGRFSDWNSPLRSLSDQKTCLDNQRCSFTAFGYFHPLMPLIPERDIIKQIQYHKQIIRKQFACEASNILFPPETAFHVRMIPALKKAGIKAVIYDSIHRYRTCKEYPYGGINEGMLPPNKADMVNPQVSDWLQLQNVWAGSKISPSLLKPEYIEYEDVDGKKYRIIGVPAERYIGNEDARGGFGALQYEHVLGQVYDSLVAHNAFDPKHPPFFVLHSDGDNHGGGADSYYNHNTSQLINWIKGDPRFELTTIEDYLDLFPPDDRNTIHIEPGSWSGADNGDPQFKKWFSRYDLPYSPDLNSWAVLTALQNTLHTLEDNNISSEAYTMALRLLLTAETSCYWYWTGQEIWDRQVTDAANLAHSLIANECVSLKDTTAPTIFPPWVTPENPGGKMWGQGCLKDAPKKGTLHTFIYDISGIDKAELIIRSGSQEKVIPLQSNGPYKSETGAKKTAEYFTTDLPEEIGTIRYHIRAIDKSGNIAVSSLERICLE